MDDHFLTKRKSSATPGIRYWVGIVELDREKETGRVILWLIWNRSNLIVMNLVRICMSPGSPVSQTNGVAITGSARQDKIQI